MTQELNHYARQLVELLDGAFREQLSDAADDHINAIKAAGTDEAALLAAAKGFQVKLKIIDGKREGFAKTELEKMNPIYPQGPTHNFEGWKSETVRMALEASKLALNGIGKEPSPETRATTFVERNSRSSVVGTDRESPYSASIGG